MRQAPIFHKATLTIVSSISIDVMEVCVLFSPRSDLTLRSVEKENKAILGAIGAAGEDSALTSLLGFHTAGDHKKRQPSASELVSRSNHGNMKG